MVLLPSLNLQANTELYAEAERVRHTNVSGGNTTPAVGQDVLRLWQDEGIQQTWARKASLSPGLLLLHVTAACCHSSGKYLTPGSVLMRIFGLVVSASEISENDVLLNRWWLRRSG